MKPTSNPVDTHHRSPEHLRRWASRQPLRWRFWHCWLKPSPHLQGIRRLYAWIPRLILYLILALVLVAYGLNLWTSSLSYTKPLSQAVQTITQAAEVKTSSIRWGRREANLLEMSMIAPAGAWWNHVHIRNTLFAYPWTRSLGSDTWDYSQPNSGEIRILMHPGNPSKEIQFRSQDLDQTSPTKRLPFSHLNWRSLRLIAGTGMPKSADKLEIKTQQGSWSPSSTPEGQAQNIKFTFEFFREREAEKLNVTSHGNRYTIQILGIKFPNGGHGDLRMELSLQNGLPAEGELSFENVSVADLCPNIPATSLPLRARLDGKMQFVAQLQSNEPTRWEGSLALNPEEKAKMVSFSCLQSIATLLQKPEWRNPDIENLSANFTLTKDQLQVHQVEIQCLDQIRLRGSFIQHGEILNGDFQLGIRNADLETARQRLGTLFQTIEDEHSWESSKVQGRIGLLGTDLSARLLEQHRRNLRQ